MDDKTGLKEELIKKCISSGILDAIGESISIQDTDFIVLFQNEVHKKIIGDHVGEYCYRAYEHRDHVCVGCPIAMTFRDGGTHTAVRNVVIDNKTMYVENTASALKDSTGEIIAGIEVIRNITERKLSEDKLRDNERRLKLAMTGTNNVIWDWNVKTGDVILTPGWEEMLGYEPGEHKFNFDWWKKSIHPDSEPVFREAIEAYLDGKRDLLEFEYRIRTKSGDWRWVGARGKCTEWDIDGKPVRFIGTHSDITGRKSTEEELKRRQHLNELLIDSLPYPAMLINKNRTILATNRIAKEAGAKVGKLCWCEFGHSEFIPDEDKKYIAEFQKNPEHGTMCYFCQADESLEAMTQINAEVNAWDKIWDTYWIPLDDDIYLHYAADITERKRTEEMLNTEKEKAQKYLDIAGVMIVVLNADQKVSLINRKGCEILGYNEEEIIGKDWFDNFLPEGINDETKTIFVSLMAGNIEPAEYHENSVLTKSGEERIVAWHNTVMKNNEGNIISILSSGEDITEHKHLEKAILEIEDRERRRIGRDLHDELGQLLTGIAFKTEALEEELKNNLPSEAENAENISALINRAKNKVRNITKGVTPVEKDNEGLMNALKELTYSTERFFNVSCDFICDSPVLIQNETAATHLYRIAQEAITNALRHGGPENIEIHFGRKKNKMIMSIKDDGAGFPAAGKTDGMGLKIMNYRAGIINALLEIKSDKEKGTLVTCTFPDALTIQTEFKNIDIKKQPRPQAYNDKSDNYA